MNVSMAEEETKKASSTTEENAAELDTCSSGLSQLKLSENRNLKNELSKEENEKREVWEK